LLQLAGVHWRPLAFIVVAQLPAAGCGTSSDYTDAAGTLAIYALGCSVGGCPESLRSYAVIQGHVLERGPVSSVPVEHTRVVLQQSGEEIAVATTDRTGLFKFTQDIPDGMYDLVLDSNRHDGASRVVLEGRARTVDVIAVARR
jgi:hypothetical protein